jgi:hypothetical protein
LKTIWNTFKSWAINMFKINKQRNGWRKQRTIKLISLIPTKIVRLHSIYSTYRDLIVCFESKRRQIKPKTKQHRKLKRWATRTYQKPEHITGACKGRAVSSIPQDIRCTGKHIILSIEITTIYGCHISTGYCLLEVRFTYMGRNSVIDFFNNK